MKKLILILLVAFSVNANAQNQWSTGEVHSNMYAVYFIQDVNEHHVLRWSDTTYMEFFSDTIKWHSVNFIPQDILNFKLAYGWGDHDGLYKPISYVPSWGDLTGVPSTFTPSVHNHTISDITGLQSSLNSKLSISDTTNKWQQKGNYLLTEVDGSTSNEIQDLSLAGSVLSLTSDASTVTLTSSSVGLGNVDNTSDANKPISTATQTALNAKQATLVSGTNIRTVNGQSLLGSTNLSITGQVTNSGNTPEAVASGTVYSLTTSSAKVDFGTNDPSITIPEAGTYLLFVNIKMDFVGLTTVLQTCNFKLRRTNNTAADLTGAVTNVNVAAATLLTATGPDTDMRVIKYTTSNSNDVIELWGNRQGVTVGNINVSEASILAVRIY